MLMVEAAVLKLGEANPARVEAGTMRTGSWGSVGRGQMKLVGRLVGMGDKRVLVAEKTGDVDQRNGSGSGSASDATWNTFRSMIDEIDRPMDEARSLAQFGRVMRRLRDQQDTEQRWRWVRRVATALAAAAGAQAVRMLSR
jgi:hypothetical protein